MTNERLVFLLTRDLFDLRDKIERIRKEADEIYSKCALIGEIDCRVHAINILNDIDSGEVYED